MPSDGLVPSFVKGIGSLSPIYFDVDQRHSREHLGVLKLLPEFLEGANPRDSDPGLRRRIHQVVDAPLQNGVAHGFRAGSHLSKLSSRTASLG
jgi:hypothetical protein